ncbi:CMGC protein kinase [Magnaporthiopsis poae ATCC 64411]|uniref:CMGC protein kinase n=1 Tax=Magnaporthiopsis poae (strain ATCC 64411 / 73-15) TaxID=644358 RepID=A0A0C4EGF7_MAGP6|nr:CMGC protein kinase [Magnaporthiopsis poae ATCC 64411]
MVLDPKYRGGPFIDCIEQSGNYSDDAPYENIFKYRKGGYHPVLLGDLLPKQGTCVSDEAKQPRYHIRTRIGHGAFSTIWLAEDRGDADAQDPGRGWVALKICTGSVKDEWEWEQETKVLRHLQTAGPGGTRLPNVLDLYDAFVIRGPNGFHNCLVTELVFEWHQYHMGRKYRLGAVLEQVAAGFAQIHQAGIAHGDPHTGNYGIAIPRFNELSEDDFDLEYSADPVIPRNPLPDHVIAPYPRYQVSGQQFCAGVIGRQAKILPRAKELRVKIIDFGRAFFINDVLRFLPGNTPLPCRPPEGLIFERPIEQMQGTSWTQASDIWGLAVMLCQITFMPSFDPISFVGCVEPHKILTRMFEAAGAPPAAWVEFWNARESTPISATRSWDREKGWAAVEQDFLLWEGPICTEDARTAFLDLLRLMLVTRPEDRITADQVAAHPVFKLLKALPLPEKPKRDPVARVRRKKEDREYREERKKQKEEARQKRAEEKKKQEEDKKKKTADKKKKEETKKKKGDKTKRSMSEDSLPPSRASKRARL